MGFVARKQTTPLDTTRHIAARRMKTAGVQYRPLASRARVDVGNESGLFDREFVLTRIDSVKLILRVHHHDATEIKIGCSLNG